MGIQANVKNNEGVCVKSQCNHCKCQEENSVINYGKSRSDFNSPRYQTINRLFDYYEAALKNDLKKGVISKEDIPTNVELNHMVYEALVKAVMNEYGQIPYYNFSNIMERKLFKEQIIDHFKYLSPINFFKLVNDISIHPPYNSSRKIAEDFLMSPTVLTQLNDFYNEFKNIYNNNSILGYSLVFLFVVLSQNDKYSNSHSFVENILSLMKSNDNRKKHIACNIINEFENESNKVAISEDSKEELTKKLYVINSKICSIINADDFNLDQLYSIDAIYTLCVA